MDEPCGERQEKLSGRAGERISDALLTVLLQVRLNIQLAGGQIVLSWNDAAYHLQVAPVSVSSAVWTNVPGASPLSLPIGPGTRFFRLINP